jgi:glycosyltransferase involved in cell wall biosynthesis
MSYTTNSSPLVSIIIPSYKQAHFLSEALDSVAIQKYKNFEIVVVNDNSPDDVDSVIDKYINNLKIIYIKNNINKGLGATRNIGIKNANGKYILPLDSDDSMRSSFWLKKAIDLIDENSIVSVWLQHYDKNSQKLNWYWRPTEPFSEVLKYNVVCGSSLFPKSMWEKIGGYDEKMKGFEDWEFWIRAYKNNYKLIRINKPFLNYRYLENSMFRTMNKHNMIKYINDKHNLDIKQQ